MRLLQSSSPASGWKAKKGFEAEMIVVPLTVAPSIRLRVLPPARLSASWGEVVAELCHRMVFLRTALVPHRAPPVVAELAVQVTLVRVGMESGRQ